MYSPSAEAMWDTYIRDNLNSGVPVVLANSTLVASAASISFTGINQTFAHLLVIAYLRGDTASVSTNAMLRFNNDAGANYDYQLLDGSAAVSSAGEAFAQTSISAGLAAAATAGANLFSAHHVTIPHYAQATNNKAIIRNREAKSGTSSLSLSTGLSAGFWRSNAAINRVTILPATGNWAAGSAATVLGLP